MWPMMLVEVRKYPWRNDTIKNLFKMHRRYVRYAYVLPIPNEIRLGLQNLRHAPSTTALCEKFSRALLFRFFFCFFPIFLMCMNHFSDILRMPSKILCVAILFFYKCNTFFIQHTIFPLPWVGKKRAASLWYIRNWWVPSRPNYSHHNTDARPFFYVDSRGFSDLFAFIEYYWMLV